jgi:hypothetical protein
MIAYAPSVWPFTTLPRIYMLGTAHGWFAARFCRFPRFCRAFGGRLFFRHVVYPLLRNVNVFVTEYHEINPKIRIAKATDL